MERPFYGLSEYSIPVLIVSLRFNWMFHVTSLCARSCIVTDSLKRLAISEKLLFKCNIWLPFHVWYVGHLESQGNLVTNWENAVSILWDARPTRYKPNRCDYLCGKTCQRPAVFLCNTYRPEWTDQDYWARLNHAIDLGYQLNENIVVTGDLNSDLFILHNNKLVDTINMYNLRNVIKKTN